MTARQEIRPQPGPQERFLASSADVVIYGGSAGGGKTFALLLEASRNISVPGFGAVIFRREATQVTNEGGLWDEAMKLYPANGGRPFLSPKRGFRFGKQKITFGHLNQESSVLDWQGAQISLVCYDELTHFTRYQFFYMLSRNRSTSGVAPYIRATCNPDADSWLADFLSWWIEQDQASPRYGLPIPERAGVIRWMVVIADATCWGDSPQELADRHGIDPDDAKSVTFIPASIYDNPILMQKDPGYLRNLKALSRVERERLLGGNWKVRPAAGMYFPRSDVRVIDAPPPGIVEEVRSWDLAATPPTEENPSPDATAGVRMARTRDGRFVVMHVEMLKGKASKVRSVVRNIAEQDGRRVKITVPQDPGQAGKDQAESYVRELAGYSVGVCRPSHDKVRRAEPFAAQWQAGNVDIVRGHWNDAYLAELEAFPEGHDDQVDASSDCMSALATAGGPIEFSAPDARDSAFHDRADFSAGAW
jgi:predicted phage terminase large subunit-like protein